MERTHDEEIHKRINHVLRTRTCVQMERSVRSESSEYARKTTGFFTNSWRIKTASESCIEEHAQGIWETNWMNLEMQISLLNAYPPILIVTILKAFREQLNDQENDQLNAVRSHFGSRAILAEVFLTVSLCYVNGLGVEGRGQWLEDEAASDAQVSWWPACCCSFSAVFLYSFPTVFKNSALNLGT